MIERLPVATVVLAALLALTGSSAAQHGQPPQAPPPRVAEQQSSPQKGQKTQKTQDAQKGQKPPKGQKVRPKRRTPRAGDASSLKKREEVRASRHISTAYPRTANLLGYLSRRDRKVFDQVLAHSRKITRRQENSALAMARKHHPELAKLILRLRGRFPRAYETAIRDLVSDAARIQRAKTRGDADYRLALKEWQLRSQARLVAARMTVANAPELTKQLEAILTQGEAAKRRQMQLEIQRHKRLIEKLERRLAQDPKNAVRSQLRKIQRQARSRAKNDRRRK